MEQLYTVEDIAKMTSLTSRTIRNYLKEGMLKGKKIGGQWRFTKEDIGNFMDNGTVAKEFTDNHKQDILDFIDGVNTFADHIGEIQTCSIIDLYEDSEIVKRKTDKLAEFINSNGNMGNYMNFSCNYIESEAKTRIVLFANPNYLIKALEILK
jgi:excisionase family DNA binding protein